MLTRIVDEDGSLQEQTDLSSAERHVLDVLRNELRGPTAKRPKIDQSALFAELSWQIIDDAVAARYVPPHLTLSMPIADPESRWAVGKRRLAKAVRPLGIAAALLAVVGVAVRATIGNPKTWQTKSVVAAVVPLDDSVSVRLPDGTTVMLDPDSRIDYDLRAFGAGSREVSLIGEARFRITHDATRPFVVRADGASTTAPNARFVVAADRDAKHHSSATAEVVALAARQGTIRTIKYLR